MIPALLELSRAYLALPGAPRPLHIEAAYHRSEDGIRWIRLGEGRVGEDGLWTEAGREWLLDLTDPATGGAMLHRLGREVTTYTDEHGGILVAAGPTMSAVMGATLAEAVARAAIALGRAS